MKEASPFKISKVLIPIGIGIVVIGWLFIREFDFKSFSNVHFTYTSIGFLLLAFLLIFGRDFGMMWRFRTMTDWDLSWKQAFNIQILNEFTSAVTPAAVGGSAMVVLYLNKEGINAGRGAAIMIANLFLDELYFIIICPVIFLLVPLGELFNATSIITATIGVIFWSVYAVLFAWTAILYVGLFLRPDLVAGFFQLVCKLHFLRRFRSKVDLFAVSLVSSSIEIQKKSVWFWVRAFGTTALSWTSRFLLVNALFMAFTPISNHLIIFGRQLLLWVVMIVSPTPGGSGVSEFAFREYFNDLSLGAGPILVIIVIWRVISYYMYLLVGVIVIPRWIKKSFGTISPDEMTTQSETQSVTPNARTLKDKNL